MREEANMSCLCGKIFCDLIRAERMHKIVVDARLSDLGLHRGQHGILREIEIAERAPDGHALSQKDIAERFGVSAAAVAMTMKKMEAEGLISRNMAAMDNRFNELHLTDVGHERLSESRGIFRQIDSDTFAGIPEEDLQCMLRCLKKMQENLCAMPELEGKNDIRPKFNRRK